MSKLVNVFSIDINECVDDMLNTCDVSATCTDADGSFQCLCDNGYSGDGFSCTG